MENKCKQAVLYNGTKMKKEQVLKNNDEFLVGGKQFRYVNKAATVVIVFHVFFDNVGVMTCDKKAGF